MINDKTHSSHPYEIFRLNEEDLPTITQLISEVNYLKKLIINIRSQTRMLHTGLHQPLDPAIWQSLHNVAHKQISYIREANVKMLLLKKILVNIMLVKKMQQHHRINESQYLQSDIPFLNLLGLTAKELELIDDDIAF